MDDEPEIIINGLKCTKAQSMTLRVAIGSFIMDLQENGLGDDEIGKNITKGYIKAAKQIQNYMFKEKLNECS